MPSSASFALVLVTALAAPLLADEAVAPFDGQSLAGWKTKPRAGHVSAWTVGAASLDENDPGKLVVQPDGEELVNAAPGHGQSLDLYSEALFGDAIIALEVMVPKGSNSGIYVMGEYEVQVYDSFGKEENPGQGDMGAIYGSAPPTKPVYRAPGEWSTYEIHWKAPRFDDDGTKIADAEFVKVVLNGATVHEHVVMKGPTPGGLDGKEKARGPLMFQGDHGPVAYRKLRVSPLSK